MKNFQQTPKQRRLKLEKDKRALRHSNPKRVFTQGVETRYRYDTAGNWLGNRVTNQIAFRGHKL